MSRNDSGPRRKPYDRGRRFLLWKGSVYANAMKIFTDFSPDLSDKSHSHVGELA
ncbi:hypothetical protein QYH69_35130 [Paraburkholderia sp. SARCC-3016]|uniref:hypothetical protein n=1 Tax=Paraburkholderia sp. SARCC-3016 TaxID=3058611 RepID=UPI002809B506|nr:hypothetical protein [Paraburkholderia sp. SARCC-3016]MDQ7982447.1 hypothetical protein [Paraburkholderia sp. SARCC-3016]